jgi:branched-chain amino acid transport system permease protein
MSSPSVSRSGDLRRERLDRGTKVRSDSIYALASRRDLAYLLAPRVLLIGGLLASPLVAGLAGRYWLSVLITVCSTALLALSWGILASVGLVSLGQALFFGAGGYVAGVLDTRLGLPVLVSLPLSTIIGAAICTALLAPVLGLRGIYFALITLTVPLLLQRVIEATHVFGGTEGLSALEPLPDATLAAYIAVLAVLVTYFAARRLADSDLGVVLRGIRDNDRAVIAAGIDIQRYKALAVFIAALPGAFAGAFMAHWFQFVGMPAFALDLSTLPLTSAVAGGANTVAGPLIGALLLVPVSEFLRGAGTWRVVFYAIVLLVFVVVLREGIFPLARRHWSQYEHEVRE